MASVVVTMKIMPESPETNLDSITQEVTKLVSAFGGTVGKTETHPVAFGIKSLNIVFVMNEDIGSTDALETDAAKIEGVQSVDVTDVRRALG